MAIIGNIPYFQTNPYFPTMTFRIDDDFSSLFGNTIFGPNAEVEVRLKALSVGISNLGPEEQVVNFGCFENDFYERPDYFSRTFADRVKPLSFGFGDLNRDIYMVGCICAMS